MGVLERPNVATHITDGRNLLLLTDRKFDLISIEVSSIWFAGSANLYSREFYAIARGALGQRGVLQQWLQLHRLSRRDIATIIGTMRSEFAQVYVYSAGPRGVLVGCQWNCAPRRETRRQQPCPLGNAPSWPVRSGSDARRDPLQRR